MSFSKTYLEKYGWKEGEGLGKNQSGISAPVKASLKFNKEGLGYDPSLEFTDAWWVKHYNEALQKSVSEDKKNQSWSEDEEVEVEKEKKSKTKDSHESGEAFNKTQHKSKNHSENNENEDEQFKKRKRKKKSSTSPKPVDLFEACEGRTAHKGARHGMKFSGKLQRLQEQEQLLLQNSKKHDDNASESTLLTEPNQGSNCDKIVNKRKSKKPKKKVDC